MEEKKGFSKKLNAFFAGKGFYIVLLLCAVLVGASFWLVGRGSGADVERDPVKETNIPASCPPRRARRCRRRRPPPCRRRCRRFRSR